MNYSTSYSSPVGKLFLATCENQLVGLWQEGQKYFPKEEALKGIKAKDIPVLKAAKQWLDHYFLGEQPHPSQLPLAPFGSAFRQEVWSLLCEIPYGKVVSYGELAKEVAARMGRQSMSAQAVGGAVGHNPLSIIIPCHRVVGSTGSFTGYAGGLATKKKLLEWEGVDTTKMFLPKTGRAY